MSNAHTYIYIHAYRALFSQHVYELRFAKKSSRRAQLFVCQVTSICKFFFAFFLPKNTFIENIINSTTHAS